MKKSFADHYRSQYLVDKSIDPKLITLSSHDYYDFKCTKCPHIFNSQIAKITAKTPTWCPYCPTNGILCNNEKCTYCYNKSIAIEENSKYLIGYVEFIHKNKITASNINIISIQDNKIKYLVEYKGENIIREDEIIKKNKWEIKKGSEKLYLFNCINCNHINFKSCYDFFKSKKCLYCHGDKLCTCDICYSKSYADNQNPFLIWNIKLNNKDPRFIKKSAKGSFYFDCKNCPHTVLMTLNNIDKNHNNRCEYCIKNKLCDKECIYCFNKSCASDEYLVKYWRDDKLPRNILKNSYTIFVKIHCTICDHIIEVVPAKKTSCYYCSGNRLCGNCQHCKSRSFVNNHLIDYWDYTKNQLSPLQNFRLGTNIIYLICSKGHSTEIMANRTMTLNKLNFCDICCDGKSRFETTCKKLIIKITGSDFISIRPNFLKTETGRNLELDLFNEELLLAFECDGTQHDKYNSKFHESEEDFIKQQERDNKKKELCKKENVYLINIKYSTDEKKLYDFIKKEYIIFLKWKLNNLFKKNNIKYYE